MGNIGKRISKTKRPSKTYNIKTIEIELAVAKWFGIRENIIVPNISWGFDGMHECDLFVLKKSGLAAEVEIKISKADFLKDFKKNHEHIDIKNRIAYFYYAMPEDIYDKVKDFNLIPEHAGILLCTKNQYGVRIHTKKSARRIKKSRKLTLEEQFKIARLGTLRIWKLKDKLIKLS